MVIVMFEHLKYFLACYVEESKVKLNLFSEQSTFLFMLVAAVKEVTDLNSE